MAEAIIDAPPAAPPPAAPVAPETPVAPPKGHEEAFGALDALGVEMSEGSTPPAPATDGRVRGPDGKFLKAGEKPLEKPKAPEPPKADDDIDPTKLKTSELAKHYHALKAKEKEWVKQREDYEKKIKAPQEWPEKKTYEEKLAEREKKEAEYNKRIADYETELQFSNFSKSQAYKDQYLTPLTKAYEAGQAETATLEIVERKDEAENIVQAGRDATAKDFDAIMRITDNRQAVKMAVQMFGDAAPVVLAHRKTVFEKNALADEAVKEYGVKGAEREKVIREKSEEYRKNAESQIEHFQNAAIEQYPQFLKPNESDPRDKELFESSRHWLKRVLSGGKALVDKETDWTDEQKAQNAAAVRNKVIAFDAISRRSAVASKRIKELEKELEQFKSSRPGNGDGKGREQGAEEETADQKIYKLGKER